MPRGSTTSARWWARAASMSTGRSFGSSNRGSSGSTARCERSGRSSALVISTSDTEPARRTRSIRPVRWSAIPAPQRVGRSAMRSSGTAESCWTWRASRGAARRAAPTGSMPPVWWSASSRDAPRCGKVVWSGTWARCPVTRPAPREPSTPRDRSWANRLPGHCNRAPCSGTTAGRKTSGRFPETPSARPMASMPAVTSSGGHGPRTNRCPEPFSGRAMAPPISIACCRTTPGGS